MEKISQIMGEGHTCFLFCFGGKADQSFNILEGDNDILFLNAQICLFPLFLGGVNCFGHNLGGRGTKKLSSEDPNFFKRCNFLYFPRVFLFGQ